MPARRFPPPREEQEACFVVRDHNGQQLAYVYFEEEAAIGRQAAQQGRGETDCANIARLPELLGRHQTGH
jgi:hypothetical protein